ncbi:MAG: glycosyltransferase [Bacteroidales bacterium]|nr:glycosyltransferase [Clostridium sp.]MCM1204383.1 glycosyltransferase [Bacteroidales bacterium]
MDKKENVEQVILRLREYCSGLTDDLLVLDQAFNRYMETDEAYRTGYAEYLGIKALNIMSMSKLDSNQYYYILSFLLQATKQKQIYKALLLMCIHDEDIPKETKYFLYNQFMRYCFLNADAADEEIVELLDDLYTHIYQAYSEELKDEYAFISKEERNSDFVMVFTSQVLGMEHGPTKTLLDRCYVLTQYLHKNVYIVNTAELLSVYKGIPYFNAKRANYIEELSQTDSLAYQEKSFPFLQCPREMPQTSVIREILDVVKSENPCFIVTIGGSSIVSDICSNIVPTITVGTVPSDRMETRGQFQTIGRKINDDDRRWMNKHHLPEEHMLESRFTFALKEQTHSFTRKDLGLPEERFIVLMVGARLDAEIDEGCIKLLRRLTDAGIFIAFMGVLKKYQRLTEKYPEFKENTMFLGFQDDVLAVNECCDLYLNPRRVGGGTSAVEALFKGLPVVTYDFGDVGVNVGEDFAVADEEEMYNRVIRYSQDKEYYREMSEKARERAEYLMDSQSEFVRIIKKMESSRQF